jgi:hypothetical protein
VLNPCPCGVTVDIPEEGTTDLHDVTDEQRLPQAPRREGADGFFREVNDRILELDERFGFREERLELICECADPSCTERVCIPSAKFAELRDTAGVHLVSARHVHSGQVLGSGEGYVVVAD